MADSADVVLTLPFDSLTVGQREILTCRLTHDDLDHFIALSGDRSPIHTDEAFARARGFGGRVVHGAFLAALVSRLIGNRLPGALGVLQSMDIEFRRPVIVPAELTIIGEITNLSSATGQVALIVKIIGPTGELHTQSRVRSIIRPESPS